MAAYRNCLVVVVVKGLGWMVGSAIREVNVGRWTSDHSAYGVVCASGQLCTFGVVVDGGSRDEEPGVSDGVSHMLEALAFRSTGKR